MPVRPEKFVVDYLTATTGVSEADLEDVASNIVDAQVCIYSFASTCFVFSAHYHQKVKLRYRKLQNAEGKSFVLSRQVE
jgi:hypothetical protein